MMAPRPLWKRALPLLVSVIALSPVVIRGWPEIVAMWPTWQRMFVQTFAVLAAAVLLAGIVAALVAWHRARRSANV